MDLWIYAKLHSTRIQLFGGTWETRPNDSAYNRYYIYMSLFLNHSTNSAGYKVGVVFPQNLIAIIHVARDFGMCLNEHWPWILGETRSRALLVSNGGS